MIRITEKPCDFCGAQSFEWYQTVCHGCRDAFCRGCASAWPGYCIRCEGPDEEPPPPAHSASRTPPFHASQDAVAALNAIRPALAEQHENTTAAWTAPHTSPAWQAFHEVMTRLDGMVRTLRAAAEAPPPPTSVSTVSQHTSTQVMDPVCTDEVPAPLPALRPAGPHRPRFIVTRFVWVSILVVFIAAGTLGVIAQQQYTLLEIPDPTHGWKERVWALAGEEIARCIVASSPGTCVVTVVKGKGTTPP